MKLKIKPLSKEQIIISIDRLTRFKEPETKYLRVFKDIITSNLIEPKLKKSEIEELEYSKIKDIAAEIINNSISVITKSSDIDLSINKKLLDYEKSVFKFDKNVESLIDNKINYKSITELFDNQIPENLKFLKSLGGKYKEKSVFPIKKILLCEGITEEILLPQFAKICDFDFKEHGIYIVSAGGKNQVVKYFYNYAECLKIPIFVLLDSDAKENYNQIVPKLRIFDKVHVIKCGEFEDLLPHRLIIKTLQYSTKNISLPMTNIDDFPTVVKFLEEFYRHRGLHEFKKSEFAHDVKCNIIDTSDVSDEIKEIIQELRS